MNLGPCMCEASALLLCSGNSTERHAQFPLLPPFLTRHIVAMKKLISLCPCESGSDSSSICTSLISGYCPHSWTVLWDSSSQTTVQTFQKFCLLFFHFFCQTVKVSNFHTFVHKREALREDTTGRNTQGLHCRPGKGSRALCTSAESQSWMVKVKPVLGSLDFSKVSKKLTTTPLSQCAMFKWWKSRLELDLEFKIAFI